MTHYEQCCARECEWCAKELPFSATEGHHWTGKLDAPRCTAPTLAQFAERCAEALKEIMDQTNPNGITDHLHEIARRALGLEK